jgi:hypothetical protein
VRYLRILEGDGAATAFVMRLVRIAAGVFVEYTESVVAADDALLTLSDVSTNDASTARHGFLGKLPGDDSMYLDGTGNFTTPAGGGGGSALAPLYPRFLF